MTKDLDRCETEARGKGGEGGRQEEGGRHEERAGTAAATAGRLQGFRLCSLAARWLRRLLSLVKSVQQSFGCRLNHPLTCPRVCLPACLPALLACLPARTQTSCQCVGGGAPRPAAACAHPDRNLGHPHDPQAAHEPGPGACVCVCALTQAVCDRQSGVRQALTATALAHRKQMAMFRASQGRRARADTGCLVPSACDTLAGPAGGAGSAGALGSSRVQAGQDTPHFPPTVLCPLRSLCVPLMLSHNSTIYPMSAHFTSCHCAVPAQVIARAVDAVSYLKSLGCHDIEFTAEDASRSDPDFVCEVVAQVIRAGATTIMIPVRGGCGRLTVGGGGA